MTLGNRVKQRRKLLGYTQYVLAKQIGLTQQAINRIESDAISRPRFILELAQVLECDPEWLLKGPLVLTKD
ncbi:helix-turn-helix transcriptional regulator [Providencia sp. PROV188]|uniref:Helix-turn-helix protein n=1 Tax=Providencia alcalifaciens TaxID=126385 RepID=A0A4R3NP57_9GAMM|nr:MULTISPECIES: helix-turn-helix transcriptional regulator [Providencia]TCT36733.1 helix-turn-helix protein [Providencia alcalifaciens]WBM59446.1 helix-turn-helix transcriptional regulator [Providencia sp. PROV188]